MDKIEKLTKKIVAFRDARDWKQFHNPKDMALSLTLEAAEVLEHFQWKDALEVEKYVGTHRAEIGEELADVLYWVLLLSHDLGIDILDAMEKKGAKNEAKYPVEKAKGNHKKWDKLLMRQVIVESPFAGDEKRNIEYGRQCLRDCLMRGEAPIASHLLYTQDGILDDGITAERALGIEAGLDWGRFAEATVVYADYGITPGMRLGILRAKREGRPVETRKLFQKSYRKAI
jgi:NTP pyrophosphatase (non-canonical NTP hydrolase)